MLTTGITLLILAEASLWLRGTSLKSHEALKLAWDHFQASSKESKIIEKAKKVNGINLLEPDWDLKKEWVQEVFAIIKDFRDPA